MILAVETHFLRTAFKIVSKLTVVRKCEVRNVAEKRKVKRVAKSTIRLLEIPEG
jgi:Zn finger protein HypA/HybF involved in hydrogenase expression